MWTPGEIRKLIALLLGFVMMGFGCYLVIQEVNVYGKINIDSLFIKGQIESGSSGLLLCFFAFFIIIFSVLGSRKHSYTFNQPKEIEISSKSKLSDFRKTFILFIVVIMIFIGLFILGVYLINFENTKSIGKTLTILFFIFGFFMIFIFLAWLDKSDIFK